MNFWKRFQKLKTGDLGDLLDFDILERKLKNHFYIFWDFKIIPKCEQLSRGIACEDRVFFGNANLNIIKCHLLPQRYTLELNNFMSVINCKNDEEVYYNLWNVVNNSA